MLNHKLGVKKTLSNRQHGIGTLATQGTYAAERVISNLPIDPDASSRSEHHLTYRLNPRLNSNLSVLSLQDIYKITERNKDAPGLEILRNCTHLFTRLSADNNSTSVADVKRTFEVFDQTGRRIYTVKEMKGDGRKLSIGGTFELIICVLATDGRELLRMEGNRGERARKAVLAVFKNEAFVGEVRQIKGMCSNPSYVIKDENRKKIILIKPVKRNDGSCCALFSTRKRRAADNENTYYDIIMPDTNSRIGGMGKIAKFSTAIPRELDDCLGVDCPIALNFPEKSLLLASIILALKPEKSFKSQRNSVSNPNPVVIGDVKTI